MTLGNKLWFSFFFLFYTKGSWVDEGTHERRQRRRVHEEPGTQTHESTDLTRHNPTAAVPDRLSEGRE